MNVRVEVVCITAEGTEQRRNVMAASSEAIAVTADRRWMELDGTILQGHPIHVELIR